MVRQKDTFNPLGLPDTRPLAELCEESHKRRRYRKVIRATGKNKNMKDSEGKVEREIGEQALVEAVVHTGDERLIALARKLVNPAFRRHSIQKLCTEVGVTSFELLEAFRRFQFDVTMVRLFKKIPEVAEKTMDAALGKRCLCKGCEGSGKVKLRGQDADCPECDGVGLSWEHGSVKNRELAFKATGIIQERAMVQINQNLVAPMDQTIREIPLALPEGPSEE